MWRGRGPVVGVLTGAQTREELAAANPTDVVDGVAALPALIGIDRQVVG